MKIRSSPLLLAWCLSATTTSLSSTVVVVDASASASTASSAALNVFKSLDYRYFVAGGTCAAISHGITTPIDVVKTRIQADPEKYGGGMRQATAEIIKTDGPQALLGGLGPTVVGYGVEGAMKFGVYEVMKPVFASLLSPDGGNNAVAFLLASIVAGGVAALLLCPMESTRIKIVTDEAYADKNLLTALAKLTAEQGFGSTFAGLWAMLAKQVPYTFGKQVSFDVFASLLYATFDKFEMSESKIKWAVSVIAAFLASLIACIFSQPGDMILTETYRPVEKSSSSKSKMMEAAAVAATATDTATAVAANPQEPPPPPAATQPAAEAAAITAPVVAVATSGNDSRKFVDVVSRLYAEGGIPKFFTGTQARIVHVGLIITSQLVIYDIVKQLLGLPATGSH